MDLWEHEYIEYEIRCIKARQRRSNQISSKIDLPEEKIEELPGEKIKRLEKELKEEKDKIKKLKKEADDTAYRHWHDKHDKMKEEAAHMNSCAARAYAEKWYQKHGRSW